MRLDEPLTFPEAAKVIGWTPDARGKYRSAGRRLKLLAMKREEEQGERFIIRDAGDRPVKVTLGSLGRYLPECMPSRLDALAESIKPMVEQVSARAREIVDERLALKVDPELQRLGRRCRDLASQLDRVTALATRLEAELQRRREA